MKVKTLFVIATLIMSTEAVQASLINGGFEDPAFSPGNPGNSFPTTIPGWQTTDSAFEIWSDGFGGVTSYEGSQHAELNAFIAGTLFQDVVGIGAGLEVGFQFAHRGRAGDETMQLTITDLGIDNVFGGSNDTIIFQNQYTTGTASWVLYTSASEAPILTLGNNIRFAYTAIGGTAIGNFLDAADFGVGVGSTVPVPSAIWLFGSGLIGLIGVSKHKRV